MAGNLFPHKILLEIRQKFNSKFFKRHKNKLECKSRSSSLNDWIGKDLSEVPCAINHTKATISHDPHNIVGKTKKVLKNGKNQKFKEDREFNDIKTKLFENKQMPNVRYQKHKTTKPTFLRRKSDPVRTFTKKDEYVYLDFTDKGKNHSQS